MTKKRVYELAKELGLENKELISRLEKIGIAVQSHSSTLEDADLERIQAELLSPEPREVVEQRIKSTVIRRRAIRPPPRRATRRSRSPRPPRRRREKPLPCDTRACGAGSGGSGLRPAAPSQGSARANVDLPGDAPPPEMPKVRSCPRRSRRSRRLRRRAGRKRRRRSGSRCPEAERRSRAERNPLPKPCRSRRRRKRSPCPSEAPVRTSSYRDAPLAGRETGLQAPPGRRDRRRGRRTGKSPADRV